jgi:hypothetical protein
LRSPEDPDFTGGQDEVTFSIPTTGSSGPFTVEIKLYYQTISAAFLADLQQDSTEQIATFTQMFDAADQTPVTVASLEFSVEPTAFYHLSIAPWREAHGLELAVSGPVGGDVDLERSTDLSNWEVLESFQQTTNPSLYEDTQTTLAPSIFYRLRWPLEMRSDRATN